jgi:hypothetical protein
MTLDDQLKYCRICENRKMNAAIGLVCGLTNEKPAFDVSCPDFKIDQPEADRMVKLEREAKEQDETSTGFFGVEKRAIKKGVWGGVAMIAIAVVWFFGGLLAGYLFYYPPVLLGFGVYAIIKGLRKQSNPEQ